MKKTANRVLLEKNEDLAKEHIEILKQRAIETTELIQYYNGIHLLDPITNQDQVLKFLRGPVEYLDQAIDSDIGSGSKSAIPSENNAKLHGLNYDGIIQKIAACKIHSLENMVFNESTLIIEFDASKKQKIMDSFYEYARDEQEGNEVTRARELCKTLNLYCHEYSIAPADMHLIADRLNLKCEAIPGYIRDESGQGGYLITENIGAIRDRLEYERAHPE